MFSQEDLNIYNRVQDAMDAQQQMERRDRRRGRVALILAWVFIPLFVIASTAAGFLAYNVYWLNHNYLVMQDRHAKAISDYNKVVIDYNASIAFREELGDALSQAYQDVGTLNNRLDSERRQRDADVSKLNADIEALSQKIVEERASAHREIAERNERIAGYIQVKAGLENSVAELDYSVRQLESANNSLTLENGTLTLTNNALTQEKNALSQRNGSLTRENTSLESENRRLNGRVTSLQSQLTQARAQQVTIPFCATNYYTLTSGQLNCVARNSSAFQATQSETRTVDLPHSGKVTLRINRSGELGSDRSMGILEHAVKTIEEYMGEPIPLKGNEIRLDFMKGDMFQCSETAAGCYVGTHMEIREKFDAEPPARGQDQLSLTIVHEVAHYYWNSEKDWLDEGAAEFLADYYESKRTGQPIKAQQHDHCPVANISSLERRRYRAGDDGFTCNYSLGEGLFLDLYKNLSEEDFQSAFRRLYASGNNKMAGIHQVRQAFYPGSEWVQKIIDKWYGYREKPEAHWNDGTFLGYMTWKEVDGWKLRVDPNGIPCATILRLNDQAAGSGYTVRETRDECYYRGDWDVNGDLIVSVNGEEYRAVSVTVSEAPSRYDYSVSSSIGLPPFGI